MTPSLLIPGFVVLASMIVIAIGSAVVARTSDVAAAWRSDRPEVLFVVSVQRWRRVMIRTSGIVLGLISATIVIPEARNPQDVDKLNVGVGLLLFAAGFLWLAHGMARMRIEVTADEIFASRGFLPPQRLRLEEITRLSPYAAGRYGGLSVKRGKRTAFSVTTAMPAYRQLTAYLEERRPDLFADGGFR